MAKQLPTPSPSPPPAISTPTLPTEINAASRKQHTNLNRLIVERLPLALPPSASNPALYGKGLAAFAQIFFAFEAEWDNLTASVYDKDASLLDTREAQLRSWLANLRPRGLSRSQRLRDDLLHILQLTGSPSKTHSFAQQTVVNRMRQDIRSKPHLLIAYGWVMYMAIFSGGRWIRHQLAKAGPEFWRDRSACQENEREELMSSSTLPGFSFLSFDDDSDGEDIKALFKLRLAEAEPLLTQEERREVVSGATGLFEDCIDLVTSLDRQVRQRSSWLSKILSLIGVILILCLCCCY